MLRMNPDVIARRMHDEVVLVHLGTDRIYTLNATAARFWELLEGGMERPAIQRILGEEFDVDERRLDEEMETLVAELSAQGLLLSDASA
jgi:hypothetical protein